MKVIIQRDQVTIDISPIENPTKPGDGLPLEAAISIAQAVQMLRKTSPEPEWVWCRVKVQAFLKSENIHKRGVAWRSDCSYSSAQEFKDDSKVSYHLVNQAIADLEERINIELREYAQLGILVEDN